GHYYVFFRRAAVGRHHCCRGGKSPKKHTKSNKSSIMAYTYFLYRLFINIVLPHAMAPYYLRNEPVCRSVCQFKRVTVRTFRGHLLPYEYYSKRTEYYCLDSSAFGI